MSCWKSGGGGTKSTGGGGMKACWPSKKSFTEELLPGQVESERSDGMKVGVSLVVLFRPFCTESIRSLSPGQTSDAKTFLYLCHFFREPFEDHDEKAYCWNLYPFHFILLRLGPWITDDDALWSNLEKNMKWFLVGLLLESLLESQESPLDRNMKDHLDAIPSSVAVPLGYHRDILELHLRVDL